MKYLHFDPHSRLAPILTYELVADGEPRRLEISEWDGRLVAYEEATELWWCTLDTRGQRDAREFWRQSAARGRVGRLFSLTRAFKQSGPPGTTLQLGPYLFHVVVGQDNNGIARLHSEATWHYFSPGQLKTLRKPLAHTPTIWSPDFHPQYALGEFDALGVIYEGVEMMLAPKSVRLLWSQGANALPLRLIAAALALGWVRDSRNWFKLTPTEFWRTVMKRRAELRGKERFSLPKELLQSPEVALPGEVTLRFFYPSVNNSLPSVWHLAFRWHGSNMLLKVKSRGGGGAMHERLEHRLELRDWLVQFFPSDEVESWFDA